MNVLLVENDDAVRTCLIEMLGEVGLHVAAASTATEALALSNETDAPAVLVADVHLGAGMDGFGLAAVARCRWPGIRTVLISGDAEMAERVSGPPHRFLPKPFRGADLLQAIRD
jgi:CheY-like chemotaxis protein